MSDRANRIMVGVLICGIILLLLVQVCKAQTIDSAKYWHKKYDSAAYKVIAARETIWHIQDYTDLCRKNPKLNKFDAGWIQRSLTDYYKVSGWTPSGRKKKQVTKHK